MLKIRNLKKTFEGGTEALKGVDLKVNKGEFLSILGPSGSGKTTLLRSINGLENIDNGEIFFDDEKITNFPIHIRALRGIGYLPQEASIFRTISVESNIFSVLENRKIPTNKKKTLLESLIKDFGLGHIRKSKGVRRHNDWLDVG